MKKLMNLKDYMKHKQWIYRKLGGLALDDKKSNKLNDTHILGTFCIALGGLILYSDKIMTALNVTLAIPQKFEEVGMDFQTYVWLISQTISPLLIIAGGFFKAYKISYLIPLYCYSLQLFLIFFDYKIIDDSYIQFYSIGTAVLSFYIIMFIRWVVISFIRGEIDTAKEKIQLLLDNKNA